MRRCLAFFVLIMILILVLTQRSRNQKDLRAHPERSEIRSY